MHSEILLYQGEWEEAEILSHKAAYLAKANDQDSIWLCSILILARISIIHGELEEYRNCMNQLEECFKISSKKSSRMTIDMIKAFLSNSLNEPDDVADWIKAGDINQKRLFDVAIPFAQMVYFKNLLLQKEYKRLIALSEEFIANCEMIHFLLPQIYIKIYTAIAYYSLGNTKRAIILLKTAFDLSLPDKLYLPFVENSELIGDLLYKTLDGQHSDFLIQHNRLSALYHDGKTLIHKEYYKSNLPFGLTAREYEIAKLASIGFQNREIAEKLFISENTVKQYLKNIFQKLNINKRSSIKHLL
jgi:LuxR family maltose regulon positive regulatory protein